MNKIAYEEHGPIKVVAVPRPTAKPTIKPWTLGPIPVSRATTTFAPTTTPWFTTTTQTTQTNQTTQLPNQPRKDPIPSTPPPENDSQVWLSVAVGLCCVCALGAGLFAFKDKLGTPTPTPASRLSTVGPPKRIF